MSKLQTIFSILRHHHKLDCLATSENDFCLCFAEPRIKLKTSTFQDVVISKHFERLSGEDPATFLMMAKGGAESSRHGADAAACPFDKSAGNVARSKKKQWSATAMTRYVLC